MIETICLRYRSLILPKKLQAKNARCNLIHGHKCKNNNTFTGNRKRPSKNVHKLQQFLLHTFFTRVRISGLDATRIHPLAWIFFTKVKKVHIINTRKTIYKYTLTEGRQHQIYQHINTSQQDFKYRLVLSIPTDICWHRTVLIFIFIF